MKSWIPISSHLSPCPIAVFQHVFNQFNTTWKVLHSKSSKGTKCEKEIPGKISIGYFSFGYGEGWTKQIDAFWQTEIGFIGIMND